MKWPELSERIEKMIKLVHAHPRKWLQENKNGIMALVRGHGRTKYVLEALKKCVDDGGRLDKFIVDYGMWHIRAENAKPMPSEESPKAYFARQGLAGSMARPLEPVTLTPEEEAECERLLAELKTKYRTVAK